MSVPCVDYSFKLARMITDTDVVIYLAGDDIGKIIYDMLDSTGIDRSLINQTTGLVLAEDYEIAPATMRSEVISYICNQYGCLFYLSYGYKSGVITTFGNFDTYSTMETSSDFTEVHTITKSNIITLSLDLSAVPDMICTRVIATRENTDGTYDVGTAYTGSAPYLDKVVTIDSSDTTSINTLATNLLANYQKGVSKLEGSFAGLGLNLFNLINISDLIEYTASKLVLSQYRVTDITFDIDNIGFTTTLQAIDPTAELWDPAIQKSSGNMTNEDLISQETDEKINYSKGKTVTIMAVNSGDKTLTVKFGSGEVKKIKIASESASIPSSAYHVNDLALVVPTASGNNVVVPIFAQTLPGNCLFAGGYMGLLSGVIDTFLIETLSNSAEFGSLTSSRYTLAGCSSDTRGLFGGGYTGSVVNIIDYVTIVTAGNATDFGDITVSRSNLSACSNSTRGLFGGGYTGSPVNVIDYVTIASAGNASDFGDLIAARYALAGCSSTTRGLFGGGYSGGAANIIDYVTLASAGNAADFGDLYIARYNISACSSSTLALFGGGYSGSADSNIIDVVTISTAGNATYFGDLTASRNALAATSNKTRGVFGGGNVSGSGTITNIIDYVTFASAGNATDFGDLTTSRYSLAACSTNHGGI
jgi:hypothetical protein